MLNMLTLTGKWSGLVMGMKWTGSSGIMRSGKVRRFDLLKTHLCDKQTFNGKAVFMCCSFRGLDVFKDGGISINFM